mmetsp:Transcript_38849/g.109936  ORF Transcript_38849/g.109936 Transcript_38849/m.109936 type:complete len:341 (-) Transcript_38849:1021-2043(-)
MASSSTTSTDVTGLGLLVSFSSFFFFFLSLADALPPFWFFASAWALARAAGTPVTLKDDTVCWLSPAGRLLPEAPLPLVTVSVISKSATRVGTEIAFLAGSSSPTLTSSSSPPPLAMDSLTLYGAMSRRPMRGSTFPALALAVRLAALRPAPSATASSVLMCLPRCMSRPREVLRVSRRRCCRAGTRTLPPTTSTASTAGLPLRSRDSGAVARSRRSATSSSNSSLSTTVEKSWPLKRVLMCTLASLFVLSTSLAFRAAAISFTIARGSPRTSPSSPAVAEAPWPPFSCSLNCCARCSTSLLSRAQPPTVLSQCTRFTSTCGTAAATGGRPFPPDRTWEV